MGFLEMFALAQLLQKPFCENETNSNDTREIPPAPRHKTNHPVMKKIFLLLILAALAVSGCRQKSDSINDSDAGSSNTNGYSSSTNGWNNANTNRQPITP
jgi:hypothetical protein